MELGGGGGGGGSFVGRPWRGPLVRHREDALRLLRVQVHLARERLDEGGGLRLLRVLKGDARHHRALGEEVRRQAGAALAANVA